MHRPGHYGASLIAYSPIGFLTVAIGAVELAVAGAVAAVAAAMVPDWDLRVPFITHRGPTHTVWFALLVGVVFGIVAGVLGASSGTGVALVLGGFGFVVGVSTVIGHLVADALTPAGIRPLAPWRDRRYTFDIAKASNPIANYALFGLGIGVAIVALALGTAVADLIGMGA
ncbi:metal-dependent hydrolase [Halorubrum vacuolatum]|uniref:Inner membrane protein n=1 Tax=Halorubrum vacuolatum TaxID=63740 RepID=A0A238XHR2_HALVU|nr:metal-dependent hydrolase [Halorubrum vacuolatum]SNR57479.1 inner membrane protein [Halorubrum vacuolatum]